jgi:DNA-binding beta-propeller fold protein YncE
MGNQYPSASGSEQQRHRPRGNKLRRRLLSLMIIAAALVAALVAVLAVAILGRFRPPPPASPLPVQTVLPPASAGAPAHLHTVADIPLPGGASRFDYQSVDPRTRLLFISHLGASTVTVFDLVLGRIRANIAHISDVHGVLAIAELGCVYASATGENQVKVIDEQKLPVVASIPAGVYPDGMAYDPPTHRLFVSDETGGTETVLDVRSERQVATIPLLGEAGNTQADPLSHRIFVDVQTLNQLVAIDPTTDRVIARYGVPNCDHDHSLLIDAASRLAFVACDGNSVLLTVDLRSMTVTAVRTVGKAPDVLALDSGWHLLYVASESGVLSVFEESGQALRKLFEGVVAAEAHSVAVDEQTHQISLPLQEVHGKPLLRIAIICQPSHPTPVCLG